MTFTGFVEGPLVWIAFLVFLIGSALHLLFFFTLSSKKDKPIYRFFSLKWMLLSIVRWLFPAHVDLKKNPVFTILGYHFSHLPPGGPPLLQRPYGALAGKPV